MTLVVNAKPARTVVLLLGDHDSSHASTDPPGEFHYPSGPDRSISLVVGPDDVSTGRWVVDQGQVDVAVEGLVRRDILM